VLDSVCCFEVPDLAAWRGRKYVLARGEIEAFLQSLNEAYDGVVRLLEAASFEATSQHSRRQANTARRLVSGLEGTPVQPQDPRSEHEG
jgi:hypothetical protein